MKIKQYYRYKNKNYLIRKGKRGGYFILQNNRRKYIKSLIKIQKGGYEIPKSFKIFSTINDKETKIRSENNISNSIDGIPLFKDCDDLNEHNKFMSNLSSKNKWFYSDEKTGKERYYGSCFIWNKEQRSWNKKDGCKISDVMETWLKETLSIECKMALVIYWFLKLYRIYGKKIDIIVKDIHCRECKDDAFHTHTSINMDGDGLFSRYNNIYIPPQENIFKTMQLLQNINRHFGYIRSNLGYVPMKKIGSSKYILTSPQGHNIMISCNEDKNVSFAVYGPINIYEPNSKIDIENNLGKYMIPTNLEKWFLKVVSEGEINLEQSQKEKGNKIPMTYKIFIDNNNKPKLYNYKDWYGGSHFYNISYKLPKNFT